MTIIKVKDSLLQDYEAILLRRDDLKKQGNKWYGEYMRIFGDLIVKSYEIKVECIKLKKMIKYCVSRQNKNEKIDYQKMELYIDAIMQDYYQQLDCLIDDNRNAKNNRLISNEDVVKIKKIYRRIAKLIHPDMHPDVMKDEKVKELWNRVVTAYTCNNLKDIEELEVLILQLLDKQEESIDIPNLKEKIIEIEKEITSIINSYPYLYKDILLDYELTKEKEKELNDECLNYELYRKQLEEALSEFNIERVLS